MNINTKFNIKERVFIKDLNKNGTILGFFIEDEQNIQYKIRHFYEGNAKSDYFYDFEIEECKEIIKEVGFK